MARSTLSAALFDCLLDLIETLFSMLLKACHDVQLTAGTTCFGDRIDLRTAYDAPDGVNILVADALPVP